MVKYSIDHGQAIGQWFSHALGLCKSTHPLNGLSKLETRHSGPSLGLIHLEFNWSNIENAIDVLRVQLDLNTSNDGNNRATKSICSPRIKCMHHSRENQNARTRVGKIDSEIVTTSSQPIRLKRPSNQKCCSWDKLIFLSETTFL